MALLLGIALGFFLAFLIGGCQKKNSSSSCTQEQSNYDQAHTAFTVFDTEATAKGMNTLPQATSPYQTSTQWDNGYYWCVFINYSNGTYQDSINTYPRTSVETRWEDLKYQNDYTYGLLQTCLQN